MFNKDNLRQKAKKIRNKLDMKCISSRIVSNIRKLEVYKNSKHVMLFYPLENEVDLLELLNDDKQFYLPRVKGENLEVCPYKLGDKLLKSNFKVLEPINEAVDKNMLDLVFVPALCVDNKCNRLGYGKGFYDRFLDDFEGVSIIPISQSLIFSDICADRHDVCCTGVVTEEG